VNILFNLDLWALNFGTYVINIEKLLFQKFNGKKKAMLGRLLKLLAVIFLSQLHMLVDFEYIFFGEYFGFEIWETCY